MNCVLADSHILIWALFEPEQLSEQTKEYLNGADGVMISAASLWELTLKANKGTLAYKVADILNGYKQAGFLRLDITDDHIKNIGHIVLGHKDPFDTLLLAQAQVEKLPLLTADQELINSKYKTLDARS